MSSLYSSPIGLIYIFNLIIGPGALTLPHAVKESGWLLSGTFIAIMAFLSYVAFTFVVEAITITNSINQLSKLQMMRKVTRELRSCKNEMSKVVPINYDRVSNSSSDSFNTDDEAPIFDNPTISTASPLMDFPPESVELLSLDNRIEMGEMVTVLLPNFAKVMFFFALSGYLFGDLAIYYKTIGNSLTDYTCDRVNISENGTKPIYCWENSTHTRNEINLAYLMLYVLIIGPFTLFNVQKTKYLQLLGFVMRFIAIIAMIVLATKRLILSSETREDPPKAYIFREIPNLIGASIYAFMCHHSIPSVITPIQNKNKILLKVALNFLVIYALYLCLCMTGVFAFSDVKELYTTNFLPPKDAGFFYRVIDTILVLFPVLTVSISFPIIAITLRNNIQVMFISNDAHWIWRRIVLPLFSLLMPIIVTIFVPKFEELVSIVGVYTGSGVQYVIPALLVLAARAEIPPQVASIKNDYCSPFKSNYWPVGILVWSVICITSLTVWLILEKEF